MTIKIGMMVDSLDLPLWLEPLIDHIFNDGDAELKLLIIDEGESKGEFNDSGEGRKNNFIFRWYMDQERKRVASFVKSFFTENILAKIDPVSRLQVCPKTSGEGQALDQKDIDEIKKFDLDILLKTGFKNLGGEILNCARFGVWEYLHADIDSYRGDPLGFWEVYENSPVSGVTLRVLSDKAERRLVLGKIHHRTDGTSPVRNLARSERSGISLFIKALNTIKANHFTGEDFYSYGWERPEPYKKKVYSYPHNLQMVSFMGSVFARSVKERIYQHNQREGRQWSVGIIRKRPLNIQPDDLKQVKWFFPDSSRFVADPFLYQRNGQMVIFVEEYFYKKLRGHISVIEVDDNLNYSDPYPVLELEHHLSFPFILEHEDVIYMIPEQGQSRQIVLYECVDFPRGWKKKKVLIDNIAAVDTTVFFKEGKWWLFTTKSQYGNNDNTLFIFFSDSLFGEWSPHPMNPVKTDIFGSRMAGSVFHHEGKLIRPAQNCGQKYGGSIAFFEILKLSESHFQERKTGELFPVKTAGFARALHTINNHDGMTVIDGHRARNFMRRPLSINGA